MLEKLTKSLTKTAIATAKKEVSTTVDKKAKSAIPLLCTGAAILATAIFATTTAKSQATIVINIQNLYL